MTGGKREAGWREREGGNTASPFSFFLNMYCTSVALQLTDRTAAAGWGWNLDSAACFLPRYCTVATYVFNLLCVLIETS